MCCEAYDVGSYTELYKTPHGRDAEKNLEKITWT